VTVTPEDRIEQVMPAFERGKFVVVVQDEKPVGILTKIDIIDFLTSQIQ
jgi:predicted transcriptional regulator